MTNFHSFKHFKKWLCTFMFSMFNVTFCINPPPTLTNFHKLCPPPLSSVSSFFNSPFDVNKKIDDFFFSSAASLKKSFLFYKNSLSVLLSLPRQTVKKQKTKEKRERRTGRVDLLFFGLKSRERFNWPVVVDEGGFWKGGNLDQYLIRRSRRRA